MVALLLPLALLLALPAAPARADCPPATQTHILEMQIWYGTAYSGTTAITNSLQLTALITDNLAQQIKNTYPARRVPAAILSWVDGGTDDIEWVLGTPQKLPAEANLRAALGAAIPAPIFETPANRGTQDYLIAA
ncbi:MAG: hypothetical protein Kow0047_06690 [Anaerolineae bacterium]